MRYWPGRELPSLRVRFHITPEQSSVILLGEDGGVKLRAGEPVSVDRLNGLVDTMPMRQREMQRPHSS